MIETGQRYLVNDAEEATLCGEAKNGDIIQITSVREDPLCPPNQLGFFEGRSSQFFIEEADVEYGWVTLVEPFEGSLQEDA